MFIIILNVILMARSRSSILRIHSVVSFDQSEGTFLIYTLEMVMKMVATEYSRMKDPI